MTVIAWDGKTLAADKLACRGSIIEITTKLYEGRGGYALSFAGEAPKGMAMVKWFNDGAKPEEWPKFQKDDDFVTLVCASREEVVVYFDQPEPLSFDNKFNAWGAGSPYAIGAMAAGKSAREAVEIANNHCCDCGMGVDSVELK